MMRKRLPIGKVGILLMVFTMLFSTFNPYNIRIDQFIDVVKAEEAQQENNLFGNGDFEDGSLSHWNTGGSSIFEVSNETVHNGNYALKVNSEKQNWDGIEYILTTIPNTDYNLSFYGTGAGGAAYKILSGNDRANEIFEDYTGGGDDWKRYEFEFNSGDDTSVIFYLSDATSVAYYDDFTLEADLQVLNLISNGDFEGENLDGWDTSGNDKFEVTYEEAFSGQSSLKIAGPQDWNGIKYAVEVELDTDYQLSFYGKGSGGAAYKVLASPSETEITENYTDDAGEWQKYTVEFNSGDSDEVIIYVSDAHGTAYYDQFVLVRADGYVPPVQEMPILSDVHINGELTVYSKLVAQYEYEHPEGIEAGNHDYRWYAADQADGEFTLIERAFDRELTLTQSLVDKYIKVAIKPIDQRGVIGEENWSGAVGPVQSASLLDDLAFEITRAETILAKSEQGDGVAQYPESIWNQFVEAIAEATDVLNLDQPSEEMINDQIEHLRVAVVDFDQGRITLPSPSFNHFITTEGTQLMDGDEELKFISYNVPGALFNENEPDENGYMGTFPSEFELYDIFETINQVNGKVMRTYTLSILKQNAPAGTQRHIMGPNRFSEEAFESMDLLLKLANDYGVRVIIPLIDHWDYSMGGSGDFAAMRGKRQVDFYTDPVLMEDFKQVIDYVMNRVNTLTGVRYKDDPAILAWETGNELNLAPEWMTEVAAHYKTVNSNQLLVSGNQMAPGHHYENISEAALSDPNIDIVKSHYYLGNYVNNIREDLVKINGQKPFFIGEFGFKPTKDVEAMLNEVIESGVSGALIWSLRPHSNNGGFVQHSEMVVDGILYRPYHWPGMPSGDYFDATNLMHVMREKAYAIQGEETPALPAPTTVPHLFETDSIASLRWRGSTGASSYTIERSENPVLGEWTVVGSDVLDDVAPGTVMFSDPMAETGTSYYYRVKGVNGSGETDYSNEIGPIEAAYYLEDTLKDDSQIYYSTDQYVVYRTPSNILNVEVAATSLIDESFEFAISNDGLHFEEIDFSFDEGIYRAENIGDLNADYLKITYPNQATANGQISRVKIEYLGDGSELHPIQPLISSGILVDDFNDFSNMFSYSDELSFDQTTPELAGGDLSRLIRSGDQSATFEYRSLGEINSIKLEVYQQDSTQTVDQIQIQGSNNGVDYVTFDDVEVVNLGGTWEKVNYEVRNIDQSINFVRFVISGNTDLSPQISRLQIGVGSEQVRFAEDYPASIVENGENYGGEKLILQNAYEIGTGQVDLGLNREVVNQGDYSVQASYVVNDESIATFNKPLVNQDRTMYDTLQMWLAAEQDLTLTVHLETIEYGRWSYDVDVQTNEGSYLSIPLYDMEPEAGVTGNIPRDQISGFELAIKDSANGTGVIYLDDVQFIQTRIIDNFDQYSNVDDFNDRYSQSNPEGSIAASLSDQIKEAGSHALRMDVNLTAGYAGLITNLPHVDWTPFDQIRLWVDSQGYEIGLGIQLRMGDGEYMEVFKDIAPGAEPQEVIYHFDEFDYPSWYGGSGTLDPSEIIEFNIYVNQNGSDVNPIIYIDEIELLAERVFVDPTITPEDQDNDGDTDNGVDDDNGQTESDLGDEDRTDEETPVDEDEEAIVGDDELDDESDSEDGGKQTQLPVTATSIYLYLLLGFALVLLGLSMKFKWKKL